MPKLGNWRGKRVGVRQSLELRVVSSLATNQEDDDTNNGTDEDDTSDGNDDNVPGGVEEARLVPGAHEHVQRNRLGGGAEIAADKGQAAAKIQ